ncbi:MAG TPA: ABC transporter ATP-binding protein [Sphaerochaeta sp.]|jgi:lipoprotein-releasing system ATP-binding protein|nr:ABC transporter ATP-binding protein [Spirochaetota bacterium]NLV61546.1 ABC transporter ATP-binding protein [Spirochaetales bacterium]HOE83600.1 ABC transporter ATP-binding protein [Sphaerochaeta sp.]HOQ93792.1 ABC transporter ATP-binding protein [Sphaerochaeta sp.]HPK46505.1 ABC transporter ATP-binding protein [Sphaerochaeta sp.]
MKRSTDLVYLHQVSKSFPATLRGGEPIQILESVDLTVQRSRAIAITGNSGSGKSTLLQIAAGLMGCDHGEVWFEHEKLGEMDNRALSALRSRRMGFIFQASLLLEDFTASENVEMAAMIGGSSKGEARDKAHEILSLVGLSARLSHRPDQLSGGEKQRVAIARALVNEPAILFADEPTGSLDEGNAAMVEDLLFSLVRQKEVALLLVTHNLSFARRCDEIHRISERNLEVIG